MSKSTTKAKAASIDMTAPGATRNIVSVAPAPPSGA